MIRVLIFYLTIMFALQSGEAQILVPKAGDSFFVYSTKMDSELLAKQGLQFYTIDFPCLSKYSLNASEEPRIDFELLDETTEESLLINLSDGNIMLKGFRIMDPYFQLSEKYIQLIKGVPLINLDQIEEFDNTGSENYFLEYQVSDLPEEMQNWAYINEYDKLRVKVRLEFSTAYDGIDNVALMGDDPYHKLKVNYSQKVTELEMKKTRWEKVQRQSLPLFDQYFIDSETVYVSYHQGNDPFGTLKVFEQPELRLQYQLLTKEKQLPLCMRSDEQVYVYPNPSFGKLNVRMINVPEGQYSFDLYNIIGMKVWSVILQNDQEDIFNLELPDLEKGIYLYGIKDANGRMFQSRRLTIIEY